MPTHQQLLAALQAAQRSGPGLIHQHWQPPSRPTHSQLPSRMPHHTQHQQLPPDLAIYAQHQQLLSGLSGPGQYHPLSQQQQQQQQQQQRRPAYQTTGTFPAASSPLSSLLPPAADRPAALQSPLTRSAAAKHPSPPRTHAPLAQPTALVPATASAAQLSGTEAMAQPSAVRLVQPQLQPLTRDALSEPGTATGMQTLSDLPLDLAYQLLHCSDLERMTMAAVPALAPGDASGQLRPRTLVRYRSFRPESSYACVMSLTESGCGIRCVLWSIIQGEAPCCTLQ